MQSNHLPFSKNKSGVHSSVFPSTQQSTGSGVFRYINILLVGAMASLVFVYILNANAISSARYQAGLLADRATVVHEENGALVAQQASLNDLTTLSVQATQLSMVPAKDVHYLFAADSVALR